MNAMLQAPSSCVEADHNVRVAQEAVDISVAPRHQNGNANAVGRLGETQLIVERDHLLTELNALVNRLGYRLNDDRLVKLSQEDDRWDPSWLLTEVPMSEGLCDDTQALFIAARHVRFQAGLDCDICPVICIAAHVRMISAINRFLMEAPLTRLLDDPSLLSQIASRLGLLAALKFLTSKERSIARDIMTIRRLVDMNHRIGQSLLELRLEPIRAQDWRDFIAGGFGGRFDLKELTLDPPLGAELPWGIPKNIELHYGELRAQLARVWSDLKSAVEIVEKRLADAAFDSPFPLLLLRDSIPDPVSIPESLSLGLSCQESVRQTVRSFQCQLGSFSEADPLRAFLDLGILVSALAQKLIAAAPDASPLVPDAVLANLDSRRGYQPERRRLRRVRDDQKFARECLERVAYARGLLAPEIKDHLLQRPTQEAQLGFRQAPPTNHPSVFHPDGDGV